MNKELKEILKGMKFEKEERFVLHKDSLTVAVREVKADGGKHIEMTLYSGDGRFLGKACESTLEEAFDSLKMSFSDLVADYRNIEDDLGYLVEEFDNLLGR